MNKKIILWFSRHPPLKAELKALKEHFGDYQLIPIPNVKDANHVENLISQYNADECITVLPLWIIYRLVEKGIKPIYAQMQPIEQIENPDTDVQDEKTGRCYRFLKFLRIVNIKIETEELKKEV
ncbi:MAG: hypothetical protein QXT31_03455 [Candidatus Bathyarchaeia archaeon]